MQPRSDDGGPVPRGPAPGPACRCHLLLLGGAALGNKVHLQEVGLLVVLSGAGLSLLLAASWLPAASLAQARLGGCHHGQAEGAEAHAGAARVEGGAVVQCDVDQPTWRKGSGEGR